MRIRVRLFAVQRELAGTREVALDLADGASVDDAWAALVALLPQLEPGRSFVRFARNGDYVAAGAGLADGDELAVIPPVSGGAADAGAEGGTVAEGGAVGAGRTRILELRDAPLDRSTLADLIERLLVPEDGAVVAFLGVTRVTPGSPAPGQEAAAARHAGRRVLGLEYEAHPEMAFGVIASIAEEIETRFGVTRLAIVHRTGEVPVGEASVAIVACAPHRDDAFDAARYAIDETKARAPIWKAERFSDGHVWIGEPPRDGPARQES
jgi:molybdopterin synthase catalytic subunit